MSDLTREERQVLAELELLSNGTTSSYQPVATKSGASSKLPPPADAPHHRYRQLMQATSDLRQRNKLLEKAREELRSTRTFRAHIEIREETSEELDARICGKLAHGWTRKEIALAMRVTETRVGQAARTQTAQIVQLNEQGKSVRGIAITLGISKSTVQRILKNAA